MNFDKVDIFRMRTYQKSEKMKEFKKMDFLKEIKQRYNFKNLRKGLKYNADQIHNDFMEHSQKQFMDQSHFPEIEIFDPKDDFQELSSKVKDSIQNYESKQENSDLGQIGKHFGSKNENNRSKGLFKAKKRTQSVQPRRRNRSRVRNKDSIGAIQLDFYQVSPMMKNVLSVKERKGRKLTKKRFFGVPSTAFYQESAQEKGERMFYRYKNEVSSSSGGGGRSSSLGQNKLSQQSVVEEDNSFLAYQEKLERMFPPKNDSVLAMFQSKLLMMREVEKGFKIKDDRKIQMQSYLMDSNKVGSGVGRSSTLLMVAKRLYDISSVPLKVETSGGSLPSIKVQKIGGQEIIHAGEEVLKDSQKVTQPKSPKKRSRKGASPRNRGRKKANQYMTRKRKLLFSRSKDIQNIISGDKGVGISRGEYDNSDFQTNNTPSILLPKISRTQIKNLSFNSQEKGDGNRKEKLSIDKIINLRSPNI